MTREDAIAAIEAAHLDAGFERAKDAGPLILEKQGFHFAIPEALVDAFAAFHSAKEEGQAILLGSSVLTRTSRESALASIGDDFAFEYALPGPVTFGSTEGASPYALVGAASDTFVAAHILQPDFLKRVFQFSRATKSMAAAAKQAGEPLPLRYPRPRTILIDRVADRPPEEQIQATEPLVSSCLYVLATTHQTPFRVQDGWHAQSYDNDARRFVYEELCSDTSFQFPKASYNADLLRFYNLGMSSDVPELQFLAFYQVLEYFFVTLSDEKLYAQLASRVNDPQFRIAPQWLDRIIQDVTDHKRQTDETEMLKMVMARYVDQKTLCDAIDRIHAGIGQKLYWNKIDRFGTSLSVSKEPNHTIGDVARIIKAVRNALVHSSDRHERAQRHLPFSESSALVRKEVPLLRFLAERVIVGSAVPVV